MFKKKQKQKPAHGLGEESCNLHSWKQSNIQNRPQTVINNKQTQFNGKPWGITGQILGEKIPKQSINTGKTSSSLTSRETQAPQTLMAWDGHGHSEWGGEGLCSCQELSSHGSGQSRTYMAPIPHTSSFSCLPESPRAPGVIKILKGKVGGQEEWLW
jgi:hypothetical protein